MRVYDRNRPRGWRRLREVIRNWVRRVLELDITAADRAYRDRWN